MSLTSHLKSKSSEVAQFFENRFPFTRPLTKVANARLRRVATIHPAKPFPYSLIGTAFDYRLRYHFRHTPTGELVASKGASLICGRPLNKDSGTSFFVPGPHARDEPALSIELIDEFFRHLDSDLTRIRPWTGKLSQSDEDLVCRYCVVLALFETFYRSRPHDSPLFKVPSHSVESLLSLSNHHWIEDLRELSWLFLDHFDDLLLHSEPAVLNPTFDGSEDIGGADGDLIIDHCLLDIKTTIEPAIRPEWIYQLVGYALLDYSDEYTLTKVGMYMSRQGQLLTWDIPEMLVDLSGESTLQVKELRIEFRSLLDRIQAGNEIRLEATKRGLLERKERQNLQERRKWARSVVRRYADIEPGSLPKRQKDSLTRALNFLAESEAK